ncbi:hypothetical protein PL373_13730 [Tenacibaculum maritimum]|nr:hypothetical protein [Tenacibaculum maritimum]
MKNVLTIFLIFLLLFSCSSTDDNQTTNDDIENELYGLVCVDFIENIQSLPNTFSAETTLATRLISLGYDLNGDNKISCTEAENVIDLDLKDDYSVTVKGIEGLVNLETVIGIPAPAHGQIMNFYNNTKLKSLDIGEDLTNFSGGKIILPKNSVLEIFDTKNYRFSESINIENQTNLTKLINNNENLNLDLSQLTLLNELELKGIELRDLKLQNNSNLENIIIGASSSSITIGNPLQNIDLSGCNGLKELTLQGKFVSLNSLDITNSILLEKLFLAPSSDIPVLDLSQNPQLKELTFRKSLLSSLDLSNNLELERIYLSENDLISIDLSNNPSVIHIDLMDNELTELNVANGYNDDIISLDATLNPNLPCIKIDVGYTPTFFWEKDDTSMFSSTCN